MPRNSQKRMTWSATELPPRVKRISVVVRSLRRRDRSAKSQTVPTRTVTTGPPWPAHQGVVPVPRVVGASARLLAVSQKTPYNRKHVLYNPPREAQAVPPHTTPEGVRGAHNFLQTVVNLPTPRSHTAYHVVENQPTPRKKGTLVSLLLEPNFRSKVAPLCRTLVRNRTTLPMERSVANENWPDQ